MVDVYNILFFLPIYIYNQTDHKDYIEKKGVLSRDFFGFRHFCIFVLLRAFRDMVYYKK